MFSQLSYYTLNKGRKLIRENFARNSCWTFGTWQRTCVQVWRNIGGDGPYSGDFRWLFGYKLVCAWFVCRGYRRPTTWHIKMKNHQLYLPLSWVKLLLTECTYVFWHGWLSKYYQKEHLQWAKNPPKMVYVMLDPLFYKMKSCRTTKHACLPPLHMWSL